MAIPNTTTFTLQDVCDELGLTGASANLGNAFSIAKPAGFNSTYSGDKNSLLNFRAYSDVTNTDTLKVTPNTYNDVNGFPVSFTITVTSNTTWTVSSSDTWITFTGNSNSGNDTFTVNLNGNSTGASRFGTITITTGQKSSSVTITQTSSFA